MIHRWGWVVLGLCLWLAPLAVNAQQLPATDSAPDPVTITAQAGFDDSFRIGVWYPVQVTISNDGPDLQGVLEVQHSGSAAPYQQVLDLPRGSRKQIELYGYSDSFTRSAEVRLRVGDQIVTRTRLRLEPISGETFVIGVVGSDITLLNSLSSMPVDSNNANVSDVRVLHFSPEQLPEQVGLLDGINALVLHDVPAAQLTEPRLRALSVWLRTGGQLVVGGGAVADEQSLGLLAPLLPVQVGELQANLPLAPLAAQVLDGAALPLASTSAFAVSLKPDARALDVAELVSVWSVGSGLVTFVAFDLAILRGWPSEPALWAELLVILPRFMPAALLRWNNENLIRNTLQLPELALPPIGILLGYILVYILAVGPLNFLLLRRMRREDWAWLTIPATIMLFVGGTYITSLFIRGVRPQLLQINIVQMFEGETHAPTTAHIGIFSPRRESFTLSMPAQTLANGERSIFGEATSDTPLLWTPADSRFADVLVDVSSLHLFQAEQLIVPELRLASTLQRSAAQTSYTTAQGSATLGGNPLGVDDRLLLRPRPIEEVAETVSGRIENTGLLALQEAVLVYGNSAVYLGDLAAGAGQDVTINANSFNFPPNGTFTDASRDGLFNRQVLIERLFSGRNFGIAPPIPTPFDPAMLDPQAVYLLGWSEHNVFPTTLLEQSPQVSVLTLYVIQLNVPNPNVPTR